MMALTVWQPWATLIAIGAKPYEFRGWPAPKRLHNTRIAIHAGARPMKRHELEDLVIMMRRGRTEGTAMRIDLALPLLERCLLSGHKLPLSSVICTAVLGEPRRCTDMAEALQADSDRIDHHMWAWPMLSIQAVEPVAPARGAQGFWKWSGGNA